MHSSVRQVLSIVKLYRAYGLQYVPVNLRNGLEMVSNDGRKATFSCSPASKGGFQSESKFLVWLHWDDSGKVVKSKEFSLFV
jgi:hypothetical protein